jgi:hypothetical protein
VGYHEQFEQLPRVRLLQTTTCENPPRRVRWKHRRRWPGLPCDGYTGPLK